MKDEKNLNLINNYDSKKEKNDNLIEKTINININYSNDVNKITLLENLKKSFFQYVFCDTSILFRILYHKYFIKDMYNDINNTNVRKLASDLNLQNEFKIKMKNNLIYPSKSSMKENLDLPNIENYHEENFKEYDIEKKSKEYLNEYIKICKYNWLNNLTTLSFFSFLAFSCLFFKFHKRHKNLSNRMFFIIILQILLNGSCIYLSLRSHPYERFLSDTYSKQIEKYKIIFKE